MSKPKPLGKTAVLQQQVEGLTKALQHERADAENLRRRHDQQIGELRNTVKAGVVSDLLPVIDNCERLLQHIANDPSVHKDGPWTKGIEQIVKQINETLGDLGVERIKTVGEVFDPHLHEAVHMDDGDGTVEVVCEELQPGYKLGDQIIRHAVVKVKLEKAK